MLACCSKLAAIKKIMLVLMWGPLFVGAPVRPHRPHMPKSASDIIAVDVSFCTSLRNFIQIGPPSAEKNDVKMAYLSHLGL